MARSRASTPGAVRSVDLLVVLSAYRVARRLQRRLVERFLAQPAPNAAPPAGLSDLTAREHEVLLHVARGLSNHEIAQTLFVSEGTVKTHIARILAKLGVRDRVQAVVLAYEAGLARPGQA